MTKIIKLTRRVNGEGYPIYVNVESITFFQWSTQYELTRVNFKTGGDNSQISVEETPKEIVAAINR
ncbi:hypothetical protein [Pedobacter terrae]|uniref:hypothetical protein n=1 Tax=Pedobacter terrae TaxID=405671 RepID=UPI002FFB85D6